MHRGKQSMIRAYIAILPWGQVHLRNKLNKTKYNNIVNDVMPI